jgi:hypothetical protein
MDTTELTTAEQALALLSEAVGRAAQDLNAVRAMLDTNRADIATRNTSLPTAAIVRESERVVDHLRLADECLRALLKDISER